MITLGDLLNQLGYYDDFMLLLSSLRSSLSLPPRYLLPLLLQYDATAEENDMMEAHGVGASVQLAKNLHAVRASQALSRLSGLCSDEASTPYNHLAANALRALLTPKLANMLKNQLPKDLLLNLTTNLESPEVIY